MIPQNFNPVVLIIPLCFLLIIPTFAEEKYHMVMVPAPSPGTISTMAELGLALDDSRMIKGEGMEIPLRESEIDMLAENGIEFTIIQEDLEKYYGDICRQNLRQIPPYRDEDPVHMKYGSMGGFYTFAQMVTDLDSMRLLYPEICSEKISLGQGWDGNDLWMVKISDNPDIDEDEPEGIFDGCHHAREPGAMTAVMYAMWYLLENYGIDPEATYLVDNREIYFVPIVNPDGYCYNELTNPYGGGMWRKNRRNNGGGCYGVDPNRNYPYMWGYNNQGSSPTPSSSTYRGPYPASEPEMQAMISFINSKDMRTGMTIHTYGDKYLTAYGYDNVPPEHYDVHLEYLAYASALNGYSTGYCYQIMYSSNGRTQDWQLHENDIINLEPEIGSSFWPSVSQIMPDAAENLRCHLHLFWCAGGLVEFSSAEIEDGYLTPGETENMIVSMFNKGWGTSEPVELELTTTDPYITLSTAVFTSDSLERRTGADNSADPFVVEVDITCPIGHEVEFEVAIAQGTITRITRFTKIVGTPEMFFADDAESGMGNWTASGGWGLCSSDPHWGTYSFADSPYGNYGNYTTAIMTMTQPVNLTAATSAWLEFWTKWDIESSWDFGQVEYSTNGSTWIPIAGLYTEPGTGQGVQTQGEPGYDGGQLTWVNEFMDLNNLAGQPWVKLRFEFRSDQGVVGDGWFVDDIQLLGFSTPVIPPDVTITLTPENPPIVIPSSGGSFTFEVVLENNETNPVDFDVWTDVLLPDSSVYGPLIQRNGMTLAASGSISRTLSQNVPANAPAGAYHYRAHMGIYPGQVFAEDSFEFTKE